MGASVRPTKRFATLPPADQDRVRANLAKMSAQHAPDGDVEAYLRDVEGLEPDSDPQPPKPATSLTDPKPEGSAAAGLFAAPLDGIPGTGLARGVIGGLMGAGDNVLHGRPAEAQRMIRDALKAQDRDRGAARRVGGGYPAAALEAAGTVASLPLMAPGAAMRASAAGATALEAARAATLGTEAVESVAPKAGGLVARALASRGAKNAATGAAWAGADRLGAATDETLADRVRAGASAFPAGAVFGAALPAITEGGIRTAAHLGGSAEDRAKALIARAFERAGVTPSELVTRARDGIARAPEMLADQLGRSGRRLARYVGSVPSEGSERLANALEPRGEDRGARMVEGLEEAFGRRTGDTFTRAEELARQRLATAKPLYDRAFADRRAIDAPEIESVMQQPFGAEAWRRAQRLAKAEGRELPQAYRTVQQPSDILDRFGRPTLREVVIPTGERPDVQTLHYLKMALEQEASARVNSPLEAGGILGSEAHAIREQLKTVRNRLRQNEAYRTANDTYAGDLANEEALAAGKKVLQTHPDEIARQWADMSESERDHFREGALDAFNTQFGRSAPTGGRALTALNTPFTQKTLRTILPAEGQAKLTATTARERGMQRTERMVLGGSPTAPIQQDIADAQGVPLGEIATAAATGGLTGLARMAGRRAIARYGMGINERTSDELSKMLMTGQNGAPDYEALLAMLSEFAKQRNLPQGGRSKVLSRVAGAMGAGSP